MSISKTKVNDHKIKPLVLGGSEEDKRPVLGADLIPHLYCTMFLVARKKSGKTTAVRHILEHCAGRDTEVIVFCATLHNDPTWALIQERLEKRGVGFQGFTDLTSGGVNLLEEWLDSKSEAPSEQLEESNGATAPPPRSSNVHLLLQGSQPPPESDTKDSAAAKPARKSKHRMPETIFVFDDFSKELRNKVVADFIKRHRHYKTKVIISSQYVKDATPDTMKNIDLWLLFQGQNRDALEHIYKHASPAIEFETWVSLYNDATSKSYGFLYADVTNNEYRENFDQRYDLKKNN